MKIRKTPDDMKQPLLSKPGVSGPTETSAPTRVPNDARVDDPHGFGPTLPLGGVRYGDIIAAERALDLLGGRGLLFEASKNNDHLGKAITATEALERLTRNEAITVGHPTLKRFVGGAQSTTVTGSTSSNEAAASLARRVMKSEGVHLRSLEDLARFVVLDLGLLAPELSNHLPPETQATLSGMVPKEEQALARMLLPHMPKEGQNFRWSSAPINNVPAILTQGKGAELRYARERNERVVTVAKPEPGQGSGVFSAEPVSGFINALFPGRNTKRAGYDPLSLTEAVSLLSNGGRVSLQFGSGTKPVVVGERELRERHEAGYGGIDPFQIDPSAPLPRYVAQPNDSMLDDLARRSRVLQGAVKQLSVGALSAALEKHREDGALFAAGESIELTLLDPADLSRLGAAIGLTDKAARTAYEQTFFWRYDSNQYSAPPTISPSLPELERTLQAVLDQVLPGSRALVFFDRHNRKELSLSVSMPADHHERVYERSKAVLSPSPSAAEGGVPPLSLQGT